MPGDVGAGAPATEHPRRHVQPFSIIAACACVRTATVIEQLVDLSLKDHVRSARTGELLALKCEHTTAGALTFLETKNGKMRRILISPSIQTVLESLPKQSSWLFTNARTQDRFTVGGVRHVFDRAVVRAGITPASDVTLDTLRHTALTRMIESGHDEFTVMGISGHSDTRMLGRYPHPTDLRKLSALESFAMVTKRSQTSDRPVEDVGASEEIKQFLSGNLVDAERIELSASALRTQRSPS